MARWQAGERTVLYLIDRGRLESFTADDYSGVAEAAPITVQDAAWAIEKATTALEGVKMLLADPSLGPFIIGEAGPA